MDKRSQEQRIIDFLSGGRTLTPILALERFGCFRLAARIYDLRRFHRINTVPMISQCGAIKKRIVGYRLA